LLAFFGFLLGNKADIPPKIAPPVALTKLLNIKRSNRCLGASLLAITAGTVKSKPHWIPFLAPCNVALSSLFLRGPVEHTVLCNDDIITQRQKNILLNIGNPAD
jgi:hypothetical protein